jgi:hypothetical protein
MTIDLQALKNEITDNPVSISYVPFIEGNDVANAEVINNANGNNPRTVNKETVDTGDIRGNTSFDGFDGLVAAEQDWVAWLTQNGTIPVNTDTLQQLAGIPTANSSIWAVAERAEMNAAMAALMQFQGSRAQELSDTLGASSVSPSDVRDARLLP